MKPTAVAVASLIGVAIGTVIITQLPRANSGTISDCTTQAQYAQLEKLTQAAEDHVSDGTPIPAGASWPTKQMDIIAHPITDPYSPASVAALYWTIQFMDVLPAKLSALPPECGL